VPRFFTLPEAESLIPEVERLLQSCTQSRQDYERAQRELSAFAERVTLAGGTAFDPGKVSPVRQRKDSAVQILSAAVEGLENIGCQLKDLDAGLIDFPTLYFGEEVLLCWKRGEAGIGFWHKVADGFAGRRPVDSEFLCNHRGDSSTEL
jgi:hypothetical protein